MDKHLKNIKTLIDKNKVYERKVNILKERNRLLRNYDIGKEIVEAIGEKAEYGKRLLKNYSDYLTKEYGKGFSLTDLKNMRQLYLTFQKSRTLCDQLSWSHYRCILPIKEEGKRNYYINLAIKNTLSVRELKEEIKNNSYERLTKKDYHNKSNNILVTSYKIR